MRPTPHHRDDHVPTWSILTLAASVLDALEGLDEAQHRSTHRSGTGRARLIRALLERMATNAADAGPADLAYVAVALTRIADSLPAV